MLSCSCSIAETEKQLIQKTMQGISGMKEIFRGGLGVTLSSDYGKLPQPNLGRMINKSNTSGMKMWVTSPGKELRPAEILA